MEDKTDYVAYDANHSEIVKSGINTIIEYFTKADLNKKRSLLLCLDKYLDPYFGYNLTYFDEIVVFLQQQLFSNNDLEVMEDIFQLITDYTKGNLDLLAENIDNLEPKYLESGIMALSCAFNNKYIPIFIKYENHYNSKISMIAKQALNDFKNNENEEKNA